MDAGLTDELIWEAVVVFLLATLIVRRDLTTLLAIGIAAVRVGVPLVYFTWYNDGSWNLLDDLGYLTNGQRMLDEGYNPLTALFTPDGFEQLQALSDGHHVLYCWWNVLAQYLFGEHYFAPVLLNVLVTFGTAAMLRRTTELLGFPREYCLGMQVFYLLHWEVIAWSSFINLKDPIVQLLTVTSLYCVARFFQRRDWRSILGFIAVAPVFALIRFYLPLIVLLAAMLWMMWLWNSNIKYLLLPLAALAGYWLLPMLQDQTEYLDPEMAVYGTVRILVTPIPSRIEDCYSYLLIPSLLHLAFLLPAAVGFLGLWRASTPARLYLIYLTIILELYAITEELQGPRHRFQVAFIFVWIQFHFLWMLKPARQASPRATALPAAAARRPARPAARSLGAFA